MTVAPREDPRDTQPLGEETAAADSDGTAPLGGADPEATLEQTPPTLRVRCPHCRNPVELPASAELESVDCPSCGSQFGLADDAHTTRLTVEESQVAHFRLVERVGAGAFGAVWKAHDTQLDRTVAVKIPRRGVFDPQQEKQFLREAQSAAQLSHPNIVPVFEVGRDGETLYIVSQFVRGLTLADWLTGQRLTGREAAELMAKVCEALDHAHRRGVVHRDLKPSNIMIDGEGVPHLMDFGLAKRDAADVTMSHDGRILGTPAYMPPEQAKGDGHTADERSDVYSLGVILFRLLTGELPFRGNARMLIHQVIHDEPPSPRKFDAAVPRDLETVVLKCLEKPPERRYASAQALGDDLRRWLAGEAISARPPSLAESTLRWLWRNRSHAAAASLVLLVPYVLFVSAAFLTVRGQLQEVERQRAEAAEQQQLADAMLSEAQQGQREAAEERERLAEETKRFEEARLRIEQTIGGDRLPRPDKTPVDKTPLEEPRSPEADPTSGPAE